MLRSNDLDIDGKDLWLMKDLYWRQQAAPKIDSDLSTYTGCVQSPDQFLLYSEVAMREVRDMEGIKVNGKTINNIRYADDAALIADSESKLQNIVD